MFKYAFFLSCFLLIFSFFSFAEISTQSTDPKLKLNNKFNQEPGLGINDYAMLLPLPKNNMQRDLMLSPRSSGRGGKLIPQWAWKELPDLVIGHDQRKLYQEEMRVVSLRLDPCFYEGDPSAWSPLKCEAQVRLIWQPIVETQGQWISRDASLHSFCRLDEQSWLKLKQELQPYRVGSNKTEIEIHPRLTLEGYESLYWNQLSKVILNFCGEDNFSRLTFMTVNPMGNVWVFGAFSVNPALKKMTRLEIPRIKFQAQGFFIDRGLNNNFRSEMRPAPNEEELNRFLWDSQKLELGEDSVDYTSEQIIRTALVRAVEFENPERHNPGTLDCVSCHISSQVVAWGERKYSDFWMWPEIQKINPSRMQTKNSLLLPSRQDQLRGFGYFLSSPIVSRRVQLEAEASLQYDLR